MIFLILFNCRPILELCIYEEAKKSLCGSVESFNNSDKVNEKIFNYVTQNELADVTLYLAGDVNFSLKFESNTNAFGHLNFTGLASKNTLFVSEYTIIMHASYQNIDVEFNSELFSNAPSNTFVNCRVNSSNKILFQQLNIDLITLNTMKFIYTDFANISMKGNLTEQVFIYNRKDVSFHDIPNNTEFIFLSNKIVARNTKSLDAFMVISMLSISMNLYYDPFTVTKIASISKYGKSTSKINVYGKSVSLTTTGNCWVKIGLWSYLQNSKIFITSESSPDLYNLNQCEIHICNSTYFGILQTNDIIFDKETISLLVGTLAICNSAKFYLKNLQEDFVNITNITVEGENGSLEFVSDIDIPIYYPKSVHGVSKIKMKRVVFDEYTELVENHFVCEFEIVLTSKEYTFDCTTLQNYYTDQNNTERNSGIEIFKTKNKGFRYKFVIKEPTYHEVETDEGIGEERIIKIKFKDGKYPNRFCNEENLLDVYHCEYYDSQMHNYDVFKGKVNASNLNIEFYLGEKEFEIPSFEIFAEKINLTIMSIGDVKMEDKESKMIENLTLISEEGKGCLYVDELHLTEGNFKSFRIEGQIFCESCKAILFNQYNYNITANHYTLTIFNIDSMVFFDNKLISETVIDTKTLNDFTININDVKMEIMMYDGYSRDVRLNIINSEITFIETTSAFDFEDYTYSTTVSLFNSTFIAQNESPDLCVKFDYLENSTIENSLYTFAIINYPIDISRNITIKLPFVEFKGKTISNNVANSFYHYDNLIIKDYMIYNFEAKKIMMLKGSLLASFSSFFHESDRINITMQVDIGEMPLMLIFKPEGTCPRLIVEADNEFIEQIRRKENREYLKYGITIALVMSGIDSIEAKDWVFETYFVDETGNRIQTDEFKVIHKKSSNASFDYIELYPDDIHEFDEIDYSFTTKYWTVQSAILILIFVLIASAAGFAFLMGLKQAKKTKTNKEEVALENINNTESNSLDILMRKISKREFLSTEELELISSALEYYSPKARDIKNLEKDGFIFV